VGTHGILDGATIRLAGFLQARVGRLLVNAAPGGELFADAAVVDHVALVGAGVGGILFDAVEELAELIVALGHTRRELAAAGTGCRVGRRRALAGDLQLAELLAVIDQLRGRHWVLHLTPVAGAAPAAAARSSSAA